MSEFSSAAQYFALFGLYLPLTYVITPILVDIVCQEWLTSGASLSAIIAVALNTLVSYGLDGAGFTTNKIQSAIVSGNASSISGIYSGCTVPGFEGMESIAAPQSLAIIFAIGTFFWIDIGTSNPGQSVTGLLWLITCLTLVQIYVLYQNSCWTPDFFVIPSRIPTPILKMAFPVLLAGVFGVIGAGLGFWANGAIKKALPSNSSFANPTPASFDKCKAPENFGNMIEGLDNPTKGILPNLKESKNTVPDSDENQFVCELYKNGVLVSETIKESKP
jgi:hypothetical protein